MTDQKNTITLYARLYNPNSKNFSSEETLWSTTNTYVSGVAGSIEELKDHGFDCFDFNIGDYDGDNKKEFGLSICYSENGYGNAELYLIDDYYSGHSLFCDFSESTTFNSISSNSSSKVFKFASADLNGDGQIEIIFEDRQKDYKNCKIFALGYDKSKASTTSSTNPYYWKASSASSFNGEDFKGEGEPYLPMAVGDLH